MAEPEQITVVNNISMDGDSQELGIKNIYYIGFTSKPFDVAVLAGAQDVPIHLNDRGVIKRIELINRTGDPVYYKLNGSTERFRIISKAVLTQHPTSLLIDNDNLELNKVIEVKLIGEES